jgi:hypothetical protein
VVYAAGFFYWRGDRKDSRGGCCELSEDCFYPNPGELRHSFFRANVFLAKWGFSGYIFVFEGAQRLKVSI